MKTSLFHARTPAGSIGRKLAKKLDDNRVGNALMRSEDLTLQARFVNPKSKRIALLRAMAGEGE